MNSCGQSRKYLQLVAIAILWLMLVEWQLLLKFYINHVGGILLILKKWFLFTCSDHVTSLNAKVKLHRQS